MDSSRRAATGGSCPRRSSALAYLPLGAALATRGRLRLGIAFAVIGACELLCAVVAEWHALDESPQALPVVEHGRIVQIIGLAVLAVAVPFLLPWPRAVETSDPRHDDPVARDRACRPHGPGRRSRCFARSATCPAPTSQDRCSSWRQCRLIAVGAFVSDIRDDHDALGAASHRFLVWVILASAIVLIYTALVAGFGLALGANGPAWLLVGVTGALAVAAEPARARVRHLVDDLVYGQRDDPLAVVRQLVNQQIASETDVNETLLVSLTATVDEALRLDHVAIDLTSSDDGWVRVAECGVRTDHDEDFALATGDQVLGRLVVGCRGSRLGMRDRTVLADVVPHVTLAVGLIRLTGELRRSRLSVVTAREEERRRLRRDLHDGVGPSLTGISMGLRTVLRRLQRAGSNPTDADLLQRLADEVDTSAREVKRIVRDLRPTALDDQGLAGALTEFARSLEGVLDITLELPVHCPLPAAVETATYRIALEALNNVVRHAQAKNCLLCLEVTDRVELDVTDDGIGIPSRHPTGVGLAAMRERATELGGATTIGPIDPHGTRVHATLPIGVP